MKSTEDFIKEAKLVHGDKYIYTESEYTGSKNKICIICPKHGKFWQEANSHLKGCGCPYCSKKGRRHTTEEFIEQAKKVHGDKYDYSKVNYVNNNTKVCIICPIHGEFWILPINHLTGGGCQLCSKLKRYTTEEYVRMVKLVHGDKYDYSKIVYVNARTKIIVICPKHGEFSILPGHFLRGDGCKKCANEKLASTLEEFVEKASKVHGNKYDYSKVAYVNNKTKVCIICPIHGEFWQTPLMHLLGQGCPKCGRESSASMRRGNKEDTIKRFKEIYGDLYDYSLWTDEYKNIEEKIPIICKEHGIFYKKIHQHLNGQGCPKCKSSELENKIRHFLSENEIYFEEQKKFDWLRYSENGLMRLDFYLPDYKIAIECQGEQHFRPIEMFGGKETFEYQIKRDETKFEQCKEHGINVLYFAARRFKDNIFTNKKELLKEIKKYGIN